jgi:hypothetical protein
MDPEMAGEVARVRRVADAVRDLMAGTRDARTGSMDDQAVTQIAACLVVIARIRFRYGVDEAAVQELATRVMIEERP